MTNGSNDWDVPFSHIMWLDRLLNNHDNVISVSRYHDILFKTQRQNQNDKLRVLCLREYTMGLTLVQRALAEFGKLDIIYIGGGWSSYTEEAKEFCIESEIGLYVSDEMPGALWKDDCWAYYRRDKDGNPVYFMRAS